MTDLKSLINDGSVGVPAGVLVNHVSNQPSSQVLPADGQFFNRSQFPELATILPEGRLPVVEGFNPAVTVGSIEDGQIPFLNPEGLVREYTQTNWVTGNLGFSNLLFRHGVNLNTDTIIAVGSLPRNVYRSTDGGVTFADIGRPEQGTGISSSIRGPFWCGGNVWVIGYSHGISAVSVDDGVTWSSLGTLFGGQPTVAAAGDGNGRLLLLAQDGRAVYSPNNGQSTLFLPEKLGLGGTYTDNTFLTLGFSSASDRWFTTARRADDSTVDILYSTDNGSTWQVALNMGVNTTPSEVIVSADGNTLLIPTFATDFGNFYSRDGGVSWQRADEAIFDGAGSFSIAFYRDGVWVFVLNTGGNDHSMIISRDDRQTFERLDLANDYGVTDRIYEVWIDQNGTVRTTGIGGSTLTSEGIIVDSESLTDFQEVDVDLVQLGSDAGANNNTSRLNGLASDRRGNVVTGASDILYFSNDDGETWRAVRYNTFDETISDISKPFGDFVMVHGSNASRSYRVNIITGAVTQVNHSFPTSVGPKFVHNNDQIVLGFDTSQGGWARSTNGGQSFSQQSRSSYHSGGFRPFVSVLLYDPVRERFLLFFSRSANGTHIGVRSTNPEGTGWQLNTDLVRNDISTDPSAGFSAGEVSSSGTIILGDRSSNRPEGDYIWRSIDGGLTWTTQALPNGFGNPHSFATDDEGNWIAGGTSGRILLSYDDGVSWQEQTIEGAESGEHVIYGAKLQQGWAALLNISNDRPFFISRTGGRVLGQRINPQWQLQLR